MQSSDSLMYMSTRFIEVLIGIIPIMSVLLVSRSMIIVDPKMGQHPD